MCPSNVSIYLFVDVFVGVMKCFSLGVWCLFICSPVRASCFVHRVGIRIISLFMIALDINVLSALNPHMCIVCMAADVCMWVCMQVSMAAHNACACVHLCALVYVCARCVHAAVDENKHVCKVKVVHLQEHECSSPLWKCYVCLVGSGSGQASVGHLPHGHRMSGLVMKQHWLTSVMGYWLQTNMYSTWTLGES